MDLFDDILLEAPAERARPSAKFVPKVKSKQSLRKEISASEHATSSVDGKNLLVASTPNLNNDGAESQLNEVASPSTAFLDSNKSLQVNNSLQDSLNVGFKSASESPTLPDVSQQDVARGKEVANERKKSLRKCKRSVVAGVEDDCGKSSRQLRKQTACEHVKNSSSLIEDDDDELDPPYIYNNIDQLEENDDEDEVDYSSKKKRALTSSKRKYVAKNGKAYKKSKKENGDSEKTTKEPPKKFSRSSQRRKRQVDQALLDDYELGSQPMSIKNIISVALYKMRQEKKEAKYSTNQSGGDFFHDAGANNEEETFNSDDDGFREEDDQARKKFTSNVPLYNSHSFKDKSPRVKWSKQDTEEFYEALKEFGPDFSMIQQLFPDKSRRQILLKFKNEDRHHPLQITDAINSRSSDHRLYKLVIAKLPQISTTNANEEAIEDTTEDMSPGINEEIATTEQDSADVKDQEESAVYHSPEQSDESDDDLRKWSQYQSII